MTWAQIVTCEPAFDDAPSAGPPILGVDFNDVAHSINRIVVTRQRNNMKERVQQQIKSGNSAVTAGLSPIPIVINTTQDELKVIDLPQFKKFPGPTSESFAAMQEWEGVVTAVEGDVIYANLVNITSNHEHSNDTAEIPLSEITDIDRDRVVKGAIFRWVIGFTRKQSGQKIRGSGGSCKIAPACRISRPDEG